MFDKKLRKICSLFLSLGFLGVNANAYGDISHKKITETALRYTTHRKFLGFDLSWFGSRAFGWRENFKGYLEKGILEGCVLPDIDEAGYLFYGRFYNPVKCSIDEEFKTSDNKNTESESADKSKSSKSKIIDKNVVNLDLKSDSALKRMYDHFNKAVDLWKEAENFVKDNNKSPLHSHVISSSASNGEDSVEIAFQWGTKRETGYVFVNGLRCPEGGTPITGAKTAITRTINSLTGKDFDGDKIRDNLFYVINCNVAHPSFANQTKSKINNASLRTLASNAFTNALKEMKSQFSSEFKAVVDLLTKVDKAEKAAEKARDAILNHERKELEQKKKKIAMPDKFKDCEKHGEGSMLIICEGETN